MYLNSKCVSISHFMCVSILSNVDETEKQYHVKFYFNFACNGHLNPSVYNYNMSRCWNCKRSRFFYKHSGQVTLIKRLKLQKSRENMKWHYDIYNKAYEDSTPSFSRLLHLDSKLFIHLKFQHYPNFDLFSSIVMACQ